MNNCGIFLLIICCHALYCCCPLTAQDTLEVYVFIPQQVELRFRIVRSHSKSYKKACVSTLGK